MRRLVLRRVVWSVPSLVIVSALTFVLAALTPGDAARVVLGTNTDPAAYERIRDQLGLDQPLVTQYVDWVAHALRGDLGSSIFTGEPVTAIIGSRLGVTLTLILGATLVAAVLGVGIGLLGAVRGGATARTTDTLAMLGMAVPTFWLGLVLILVFASRLGWFPASGFVPFAEDPLGWLRSFTLPVLALATAGIATIAKQTRGAVLDAMGTEYVRALRANGLPDRRIVLRHCLKNAAVPITTVVGLVMVGMMGGTVLVEQLFALPGLGQLTVTATQQHDLPVLVGVVTTYTIFVLASNLLTDVGNGWLNPRLEERA
jgi:peptide/nickel transport system permease protein